MRQKTAQEVIKYLRSHGQRTDTQISEDRGIPLNEVRCVIADLAQDGAITKCKVTRFIGVRAYVHTLCRASGYIPPVSTGRRPGPRPKSGARKSVAHEADAAAAI